MNENDPLHCDYCDTDELTYELRSDRGSVVRCIPCLAIEQGQQQLQTPFDQFIDFDPGVVWDSEGEVRETRKNSYERARAWWTVLARWRQDEPLLERDSAEFGKIHEDTRTFLKNIMGSAAFYPPSEIVESDGDPEQSTLADTGQEVDR